MISREAGSSKSYSLEPLQLFMIYDFFDIMEGILACFGMIQESRKMDIHVSLRSRKVPFLINTGATPIHTFLENENGIITLL